MDELALTAHEEQGILELQLYWDKCGCNQLRGLNSSYSKSQWKRIGRYLWRLEAHGNSGSGVYVTLRCNWPVEDPNSFEGEAILLISSGAAQKKTTIFSSACCSIPFDYVCLPNNETIRVVLQIRKQETTPEQEDKKDVTFVVEEKELLSNSKLLTKLSPVFATMLEGNFVEAETKRVTIQDATFDEFSSFLEALLRNGEITAENLESLHRLADKYDTKVLTLRCRIFVWTSDKMQLIRKFTLAEVWEDDDLLKKLTGEICDAAALKKLEQADMITTLRSETFALILKKAISLM